MPLASWLIGFDRYKMVYSKRDLPKSYPGKFYMLGEEEDWSIGINKARSLSKKLGSGDDVVWIESWLPMGEGGMEKNRWTGTGVGWGWPDEEVPVRRMGLFFSNGMKKEMRHEEIAALAFARGRASGQMEWESMEPRTFSVLPIANACQARCAFCFSKASASEAVKQRPLDLELGRKWAREARKRGVLRAVITGGGEPTLCKPEALESLVRMLSEEIGSTLVITNGAIWGNLSDSELHRRLECLANAGLTRIALSRHGVGAENEERILGIKAKASRVVSAILEQGRIKTRSICVLQKGGVDTQEKVKNYIKLMAEEGVSEICFKELYVSSLAENSWAESKENKFAADHQVPLSMVRKTLKEMGFESERGLPWGAPIFEGEIEGLKMSIATYTEPSVGWEIAHKTARSWNLMADGSCLASLEDPASVLILSEIEKAEPLKCLK